MNPNSKPASPSWSRDALIATGNLSSRVSLPRLALLLALGAAVALACRAAPPVIGSQLFQETNGRLEDLFQYRNAPPKPITPRENPFRPIDAPAPPSVHPAADPTTPADTGPKETADESLLRQAFASLNFGGLLQVGDRQLVMINKATYKEGGLISVRVQGANVYLRIVSLTKDTITFGLNEARLTLHF